MSDPDEGARQAQREARRNWRLAWAWSLFGIPPNVVAFFIMDFETFAKATLLETIVVSFLALSIGQAGVAKGAEAKAAGYENP